MIWELQSLITRRWIKINHDRDFGIRPIVKQIEGVLRCQPARIGTEEESRFEAFKGGTFRRSGLVRRSQSSCQYIPNTHYSDTSSWQKYSVGHSKGNTGNVISLLHKTSDKQEIVHNTPNVNMIF